MRGDAHTSTLSAFRRKQRFGAPVGANGRGKNLYGRKGSDVVIPLPCGTVVWRKERDGNFRQIGDLIEDGESLVLARGGDGGRGNTTFVSAIRQAPYVAEAGGQGEEGEFRLELKLIADVGIVGKPNAGKSTLLSTATAATPKVADYPFTTLEPQLGVVSVGWQTFVLAEVPGLLEGAHEGVGLGQDFLRHATRTRALIHLVDGSEAGVSEAVRAIDGELEAYGQGLDNKPQIVVVNKCDIPEVEERRDELARQLGWTRRPVRFISAAAATGVDELMKEAAGIVAAAKAQEPPRVAGPGQPSEPPPAPPQVGVSREDGVYVVDNEGAARLIAGSDLGHWTGRVQVKIELDRLGVTEALEDAGIRLGDAVRFGEIELEW